MDDVVSDLLPGGLQPEPPTTVRMLLDHTSGLFNVGDEGDVLADITKLTDPVMRSQAQDLADRYLAGERVTVPAPIFVALAETHDRYFLPGTGYHYSNVNYQVAGDGAGEGDRDIARRPGVGTARRTARAAAHVDRSGRRGDA